MDPVKAFECIKAYTTPVGSESAFIHHGTPLPIQMYAYADLWNNSLSQEALRFLYPRLKQYFEIRLSLVGSEMCIRDRVPVCFVPGIISIIPVDGMIIRLNMHYAVINRSINR